MLSAVSDVMETIDFCGNFKKKLGCLDMCQYLAEGQFLTLQYVKDQTPININSISLKPIGNDYNFLRRLIYFNFLPCESIFNPNNIYPD